MKGKSVKISKGNHGWGGPLTVKPDDKKKYVISVTGGGIDPVAQKIADITGAPVVDAFADPVPKEETFVAVINCGGRPVVVYTPKWEFQQLIPLPSHQQDR